MTTTKLLTYKGYRVKRLPRPYSSSVSLEVLRIYYAYKCRLLIYYANILDTDQARLYVGPDLDQNCLTL